MPAEYEKLRDALIRQGKSTKEAKRIAAKVYNKRHPGAPLRPHKEKKR